MVQPLPTKINLKKKRAQEGRSGDEVEHFPVPSSITVTQKSTAATTELRDSGVLSWIHLYNFSLLTYVGY